MVPEWASTGAGSWNPKPVQKWEYLVVPFKDAGDHKKIPEGLSPNRLNELGSQAWTQSVFRSSGGDLVAWPVVLLKCPVD